MGNFLVRYASGVVIYDHRAVIRLASVLVERIYVAELYAVGSVLITQRTLTIVGSVAVHLVSSLTRLDLTNKENMLFFVCCEAVVSKLEFVVHKKMYHL